MRVLNCFVSSLALCATSTFAQGLVGWDKDGVHCIGSQGNACITRGGDNTIHSTPRFSDGNACADRTFVYTSTVGRLVNSHVLQCVITVKLDPSCCVNGKCSVQEVDRNRQVKKTTALSQQEQIGKVHFSEGCAPDAYIQGETRIV